MLLGEVYKEVRAGSGPLVVVDVGRVDERVRLFVEDLGDLVSVDKDVR